MSKYPPKSSAGFTLVEMAIVLLIIGLALGMVLNMSSGMRDAQNRQLVRAQLNTLDIALANFVAQHRRLPCPADGRIASGALNAGVEIPFPATGLCAPAAQTFGVVPWITLGISENDATDPWNGRFTFRVDPALAGVAPLLMDMSNCDPSATGPSGVGGTCQAPILPCTGTVGCTSPTLFLTAGTGKGLDVWDGINGAAGFAARQNNRAAGTGAAYVVISHGPTGAGAYNKSGNYQSGTIGAIPIVPAPALPPFTQPAGNDEIPNLNNQALALPTAQVTAYRDAPLFDTRTQTNFDDYLSHPTIMSVLNKANLGPRAHQ